MKLESIEQIRQIWRVHQEKIMWVLFTLAGIIIWTYNHGESNTTSRIEEAPVQVDTVIPIGHLLIPIELENKNQIEDLLGPQSIVDLYQVPLPGQKGQLVGRRFRLLRAPLNPSVFAILVRENEAEQILSLPGPFRATLRNPEQSKHEMKKSPRPFHVESPTGGI